MPKTIYYAILTVVVIGAISGIYYYSTRAEIVVSDKPAVPPTNDSVAKPRVDHGDFQKRFEPKLPSPDLNKSK